MERKGLLPEIKTDEVGLLRTSLKDKTLQKYICSLFKPQERLAKMKEFSKDSIDPSLAKKIIDESDNIDLIMISKNLKQAEKIFFLDNEITSVFKDLQLLCCDFARKIDFFQVPGGEVFRWKNRKQHLPIKKMMDSFFELVLKLEGEEEEQRSRSLWEIIKEEKI